MEMIREAASNREVPTNSQDDESEKCCGSCRFSRTAPDLEMKCMRHKIRTDYICRCNDWQRDSGAGYTVMFTH